MKSNYLFKISYLFSIFIIIFSKKVNAKSFTLSTAETTNLKQFNSNSSDTITSLEKDTQLEIISINGNWVFVSFNGNNGFVELASLEGFNSNSAYKSTLKAVPLSLKNEYYSGDYNEPTKPQTASIDNNNIAKNNIFTALKDRANNVTFETWEIVKNIFKLNQNAEVYDVLSGKTYFVKSFSNGNHADVEPSTTSDTNIMFETFGKEWSWDVRPVWVSINGKTIAGSINGMPHGEGINHDNNMDGQVCIHFLNSKTHNGNEDFTILHQNIALEAYNLALAYANN